MSVEAGVTEIADLNELWPLANDPRHQGDDHLRLIKVALKSLLTNLPQVGIDTVEQTLSAPSTEIDWSGTVTQGCRVTVILTQDGTGGRAVTWSSKFLITTTDIDLDPDAVTVLDFVGTAAGKLVLTQYGHDVSAPTGLATSFVDRGDPADYDKTSWTRDNAWHDWDLSAIVPAGAKAVLLRIYGYDESVGQYIFFRKNGNANAANTAAAYTQGINYAFAHDLVVACDTDRIIEYLASTAWNTAFPKAVVRGWWL